MYTAAKIHTSLPAVLSCPPDSYFYTDTNGFTWDRQMTCWVKDNLAADLSHSRLSPSPPPSTVTLPSSSSLDGSDYTLRTDTPDLSSYYNPTSHTRPLSQMSYRSDDLQTIPSQDVSASLAFMVQVFICMENNGVYRPLSLICLFR